MDVDICNYMNELLVNPASAANSYKDFRCTLRNGRMYFNFLATASTTSAQFSVYFYFDKGTATDRTGTTVATGPAHKCFGFPQPQQVYTIEPDHGGPNNKNTDAAALESI